MLKGDLTSTPLAPLLLELAEDTATGCLHITDISGDEALVYFKAGLVYSVSVPGTRPQLGAKLVSSGALAPEALSEALEAQRSELQGWRLGELLVHLGYVDQPVVEAFVKEQVSEALWDLLRWADGKWKFRKNIKAREDVGPPMGVVELLETLRERGYEWETISAVVHGPAAVPKLSTRGDTSSETTLDNDAWSMLCKIDGERSVADLARDCGYTLFEAGHVIVSLVEAGLVDIEEDIDVASTELYGATTLSSAFAGEVEEEPTPEPTTVAATEELPEEDALTKLARLVNEVAGDGTAEPAAAEVTAEPAVALAETSVAPAQRTNSNSMLVGVNQSSGESFAANIARVSSALSDVLGEASAMTDEEAEALRGSKRRSTSTDDPEWQRRKRLRSAAAAELASAQALIETLRSDHDGTPTTTPEYTGDVPKVLSRENERKQQVARDQEEADRHAAEEAARVAAEQFARAAADEAERHAAEQEAQRVAAEQAAADEAARLEAEAAEQAAAEAEAAAAAEAEAAAVEMAERLRKQVEEAETIAWDEYWHREEAERQAAADAAAQAAADEAARAEAEEAQRAAEAEAERVAAEAAHAAAEAEAERLAAEEADRLIAEANEAAERERIAAEHAEAEAAAEAERQAADAAAEQERQAAAAEAERIAAEEAAAQAAAAKAERAARRKADKLAAEEAQRREDEAAAATALLAEFTASEAIAEPEPEPEAAPELAAVPEPEVAAEVREPVGAGAPWTDDGRTDTAALLRELSSLGGDEPAADPGPSRPRANAGPDKKVKKKIGLFGL